MINTKDNLGYIIEFSSFLAQVKNKIESKEYDDSLAGKIADFIVKDIGNSSIDTVSLDVTYDTSMSDIGYDVLLNCYVNDFVSITYSLRSILKETTGLDICIYSVNSNKAIFY